MNTNHRTCDNCNRKGYGKTVDFIDSPWTLLDNSAPKSVDISCAMSTLFERDPLYSKTIPSIATSFKMTGAPSVIFNEKLYFCITCSSNLKVLYYRFFELIRSCKLESKVAIKFRQLKQLSKQTVSVQINSPPRRKLPNITLERRRKKQTILQEKQCFATELETTSSSINQQLFHIVEEEEEDMKFEPDVRLKTAELPLNSKDPLALDVTYFIPDAEDDPDEDDVNDFHDLIILPLNEEDDEMDVESKKKKHKGSAVDDKGYDSEIGESNLDDDDDKEADHDIDEYAEDSTFETNGNESDGEGQENNVDENDDDDMDFQAKKKQIEERNKTPTKGKSTPMKSRPGPASKKKTLQCSSCPTKLSGVYALRRHEQEMHSELQELHVCSVCGMKFTRPYNLLVHRSEVHKIKKKKPRQQPNYTIMICNICQLRFRGPASYWEHLRKQHTVRTGIPISIYEEQVEVPYTFTTLHCAECPLNFTSVASLKSHVRKVHLRVFFKCPFESFCDKKFTRRYSVRVHLKEDHNGERVDELFGKKSNKFRILGERKGHKCPLAGCEEAFELKQDLAKHLESLHYGAMVDVLLHEKIICKVCNKYVRKKDMEDHMSEHTGIKRHLCEHCGKEFHYERSMKHHVAYAHKRNRLPCRQCPMKFDNSSHRDEHEIYKHGDPNKPCYCPLCGKEYKSEYGIQKHMAMSHDDTRFTCTICNLVCDSSLNLRHHVEEVHKRIWTEYRGIEYRGSHGIIPINDNTNNTELNNS